MRLRLRFGRLLGARGQHLIGRFAVEIFVIETADRAHIHYLLPLGLGQRTDARLRRAHQRALDHRRRTLAFERRDQRLAGAEIGDHGGAVEVRVRAEGVSRRLHGLLVARRIGAKRVLNAVTELAEDRFRHVERVLRDEVDAHALGSDEAHDLFDALRQHLRRIVEEQVRLVEEEHQLRLVRVAHLGQFLEQLRKQPKQEGRVKTRVHHQLVGRQHRNRAAPVIGRAHDVGDLQRRFAEEMFRTLLFQDQQFALDRADGGLGDEAELVGKLGRVLAHIVEQRLQVLQVEQRQAALVGDLEGDVEHALLRIGRVHQP
ncbi:hypothetical protein D9M72_490810 [compost metagenome]